MASLPQSDISAYRTFDPSEVNAIVNHPEVLPGLNLGLADELDVAPLLENPRNICLMGDYGGLLSVWSAPGVYDLHDFVLPGGRGKWARQFGVIVLRMLFESYDARMLWAQTPVDNRACRLFNRMLGFKSHGIEQVHLAPNLAPISMEIFTMDCSTCQ